MKAELLIVLLSSFNLFAQIKFEKGYFIDSQNRKVECLIKNQDWINPPKQIEYKLSEDSKMETINFSQINSFQVYETSHYYVKYIVNVDKNLSGNFNPKLETIILKVLVDGMAKLYYNDDIFFYQINNNEIKQLVYKKEIDNVSIKEDNLFRAELYNNLRTEQNQIGIRKLKYDEKELITFFRIYNQNKDSNYKFRTLKQTKTILNLNVMVGSNFSKGNFVISELYTLPPSAGGGTQERDANLMSNFKVNVLLGFEAEVLLPFNKNKWAIFTAPNYQQNKYQMSKKNVNPLIVGEFGTASLNCSYSYFEIPFGIRHYFNLNEKTNLFLDGACNLNFITSLKEDIEFQTNSGNIIDLEENFPSDSSSSSLRIGFGYNYNKKYSFSFNYFLGKKLSNSELNSLSFIASYKLF